jgi:hypothetical protein
MLQKQSKNLTGKALATGLLAAWMSVTPIANAGGPNEGAANDVSFTEGSQPASQELNAWQLADMAQNYSIENNAVGIFVNKAPDTDLSADQIGSMIVRKFQEAGIPAAFTHNSVESGETSIDFFVKGTPYAGYALNAAFDGFQLVSSTYKALQKDGVPVLTLDVATN